MKKISLLIRATLIFAAMSANGGGIRNARITLTSASGETRTAISSAFDS